MTPVSMSYTVAPLEITSKLPHIGPPLEGKGWVAVNGCCGGTAVHRASSLSCNGAIYYSQRFASTGCSWIAEKTDGRRRWRRPQLSDYGAKVLAVADGTVVGMLNDLNDQKPGSLPDPKTITLENVDGNHIVIDLGNGVYAFYAHLQKGSVNVKLDDRVKRRQVLAKLGNTGNNSEHDLHFDLMGGSSPCARTACLCDRLFTFAGQGLYDDFAKATGVEGDFSKGLRPAAARHEQYPMDLDIISFEPVR